MEYVNKKIEKLVNHLSSKRICLVSHVHPDGDAVGSVIGFSLFLKNMGYNVRGFLKDGIPYQYTFLYGRELIEKKLTTEGSDVCILLDASEFSRTGFEKPDIPIIRIDHHKTGEIYSEYDIVETKSPATVSLVLALCKKWDERYIDENVARAFYTGLLTDTVSFLHANLFTWAFQDALYLSQRAHIDDIGFLVYERKRKSFYALLMRALKRLSFDFNDKLAYTFIKNEDFKETNANGEDTDGIVRHVVSIDGVEVGVNFIEYEKGIWKVSARGKGKVDLALLCGEFGGGGHKNAAGCSIEGRLEEVIAAFKKVFRRWEEYL